MVKARSFDYTSSIFLQNTLSAKNFAHIHKLLNVNKS